MSKSKEERDAEAGYAFDWIRQRQSLNAANKETKIKLKKKIDKLSGKNKALRHK